MFSGVFEHFVEGIGLHEHKVLTSNVPRDLELQASTVRPFDSQSPGMPELAEEYIRTRIEIRVARKEDAVSPGAVHGGPGTEVGHYPGYGTPLTGQQVSRGGYGGHLKIGRRGKDNLEGRTAEVVKFTGKLRNGVIAVQNGVIAVHSEQHKKSPICIQRHLDLA